MMASEAGASGDRGRKRKRQRVSFAAGELLEEVRRVAFSNPAQASACKCTCITASWLVPLLLLLHGIGAR